MQEDEYDSYSPPASARSQSYAYDTPMLAVGTPIRIRDETKIHPKLHGYANTFARIRDMPVHPNTWFGVELLDGRTAKIRKSAFDVATSDDDIPESAKHPAPFPLDPPRRPSNTLNIVSPADVDVENVRVTITENNDVMNKFPDLLHCEGKIIGIPKHPNTWFTVQMDEGRVVKMRKSALKFHDGQMEKAIMQQTAPRKTSPSRRSYSSMSRFDDDLMEDDSIPNYDSWVGHYGTVRRGRFKGYVGYIMRYGSGKFHLKVDGSEVIKDAGDVLYGDSSAMMREMQADNQPSSPRKRIRRSRSTNFVGKRVVIVHGQHVGNRGLVIKGGNGYYHIQLQGDSAHKKEIITKRNNEIRILRSESDSTSYVNRNITVTSGPYAGQNGRIIDFAENMNTFRVHLDFGHEVSIRATDLTALSNTNDVEQDIWSAAGILMNIAYADQDSMDIEDSASSSEVVSALGKLTYDDLVRSK